MMAITPLMELSTSFPNISVVSARITLQMAVARYQPPQCHD
jgi:hypothetical protein